MTTPIELASGQNLLIKVYNGFADYPDINHTLFFKSNILELFLQNEDIYNFLLNPKRDKSLSFYAPNTSSAVPSIIVSRDYFLIYYILYIAQSTFLNIDTFINEVYDEGLTFFQYNIVPVTKQATTSIDNLGYYNGKQLIISCHPDVVLNLSFQESEKVFFENIGDIDLSKTMFDLESFNKLIDVLYLNNTYYNSKNFRDLFGNTMLNILLDENAPEIEEDEESQDVSKKIFKALSKSSNLSKTIGINAKTLTLGDIQLMSPLANPEYEAAAKETDKLGSAGRSITTGMQTDRRTSYEYKSPVESGYFILTRGSKEKQSFYFNDKYFTKVLKTRGDISESDDEESISRQARIIQQATFNQYSSTSGEFSALNDLFMHTETLFSLYDDSAETFLNIEMLTENRIKIKRIDATDIYNDSPDKFGTTFQLNSEIKPDLTKNYETYPVFLKKEISEAGSYISGNADGADAYKYLEDLNNDDFEELYSYYYDPARKATYFKPPPVEATSKRIFSKTLDVLNNFYEKNKINKDTLSYIESSSIIEDEGVKYIQINTKYRFLNNTEILPFSEDEFDVHYMVPILEIKTIAGTIKFDVYSDQIPQTFSEAEGDAALNIVTRSTIYRCSLEKIYNQLTGDSSEAIYSNIDKYYNKKVLFNYNLHRYLDKELLSTLYNAYSLDSMFEDMFNKLNTNAVNRSSDLRLLLENIAKNRVTVLGKKELDDSLIPDEDSDSSKKEVTKIGMPLRITSETYSIPDTLKMSIGTSAVQDLSEEDSSSSESFGKINEISLITDEVVLLNGGKSNIPSSMKHMKYNMASDISHKSRRNNVQPRLLQIIYNAFLDTKNKFPTVDKIQITSGGDPPMWKWAESITTGINPLGYSKKRRKTLRHDLGFAADIQILRKIPHTDTGVTQVKACLWSPHDNNDFLIFKFFIERCRKYGAGGIGAGRGYMDDPRNKKHATVKNKVNAIHVDIAYLNPTYDQYKEKQDTIKAGLRKLGVSEAKIAKYNVNSIISMLRSKNDFWGEDDTSKSAETWLKTIFGKGKGVGKFDIATVSKGDEYLDG